MPYFISVSCRPTTHVAYFHCFSQCDSKWNVSNLTLSYPVVSYLIIPYLILVKAIVREFHEHVIWQFAPHICYVCNTCICVPTYISPPLHLHCSNSSQFDIVYYEITKCNEFPKSQFKFWKLGSSKFEPIDNDIAYKWMVKMIVLSYEINRQHLSHRAICKNNL